MTPWWGVVALLAVIVALSAWREGRAAADEWTPHDPLDVNDSMKRDDL